jgi:hypothetical protein
MGKLLKLVLGNKKNRKRVPGGGIWMQTQLVRMTKMHQGVISMSGTK